MGTTPIHENNFPEKIQNFPLYIYIYIYIYFLCTMFVLLFLDEIIDQYWLNRQLVAYFALFRFPGKVYPLLIRFPLSKQVQTHL